MQSKPYFIHIRNTQAVEHLDGFDYEVSPLGGTTIAVVYSPELEAHIYAVAKCSNKENYNKKVGRAIATGRLRTQCYVLNDCATMREAEMELRSRFSW